jgi:uncharacterized OsmC-like protein
MIVTLEITVHHVVGAFRVDLKQYHCDIHPTRPETGVKRKLAAHHRWTVPCEVATDELAEVIRMVFGRP